MTTTRSTTKFASLAVLLGFPACALVAGLEDVTLDPNRCFDPALNMDVACDAGGKGGGGASAGSGGSGGTAGGMSSSSGGSSVSVGGATSAGGSTSVVSSSASAVSSSTLASSSSTLASSGGAGGSTTSGSGGAGGGVASSTGSGGATASSTASAGGSTNGSGGSAPIVCTPACTGNDGTCCGGTCVDTAIDPLNCNGCGITCNAAASEICESGGSPQPVCANVDWARWTMPNSPSSMYTYGGPNSQTYVDTGKKTVLDKVTGLLWQQVVSTSTYTWQEAKDYCSTTVSNQGLGGYNDWRLPSRIELLSIVDYDFAIPIDQTFFPSAQQGIYWSTTSNPSKNIAWIVDFTSTPGTAGSSNSGGSRSQARNLFGYVRCVR